MDMAFKQLFSFYLDIFKTKTKVFKLKLYKFLSQQMFYSPVILVYSPRN